MLVFSTVCSQFLLYHFGSNVRDHSKEKSKYCNLEFSKLGLNNHHFNLRTLCIYIYYKQLKYMANCKHSSNDLLI